MIFIEKAKKVLSFIKKRKIFLIIILLLLLLVFSYYANEVGESKKISNSIRDKVNGTSSGDGSYTISGLSGELLKQISINTTDGSITIKEDILNKLVKNLEESEINLKKYGVSNSKEFVKKVLEAEIATYLPDFRKRDKIGTKTNDGKLYGSIRIRRHYKDGTFELLEYKSYEEYRKEVAKFGVKLDEYETQEKMYKTKEEVDKAYNNIKRFFTLDKDGNILIATISSTQIDREYSEEAKNDIVEEDRELEYEYTYTLKVSKLNYRPLVAKYAMPAEFLTDLLVITTNEEFVTGAANLAKNGKIIISVQDNETNTVNVNEYQITKKYKTKEQTNDEPPTETNGSDKIFKPYITTTTTIDTNTMHALISDVDTWFVNYRKTFEYSKVPQTVTNNEYSEEDDNDWTEVDYDEEDETTEVKNELGEVTSSYTDTIKTWEYEKKVEKIHTITETKNSNKFIDGVPVTIGNENRFLGLLKNRTGVYEQLYNTDGSINNNALYPENKDDRKLVAYKSLSKKIDYPQNRLISGANIFFQLLSERPATAEQEKIMKYLLYLYTDDNYGVKSIDFTQYNPAEFSTGGTCGVFGTSMTREEFVEKAEAYKVDDVDYQENMAAYAGEFYDICTSVGYNVNPALAYAHACLETGYGSSRACKEDKNYFGYAHYNNASSGSVYSSPSESIEDYCSWVVYNATPGTDAYNANNARAELLSPYSSLLNGTADSNIYVLYIRYAVLNATHDGKFGSPEWFTREGLGEQCNHQSGSETTFEEHAKYAEYTTNKRVKISAEIFGTAGAVSVTGETYTASNGKTYGLFKQGDYADLPFYEGTVANYGCSLTASAIVASGYNSNATPRSLYTDSYINGQFYFDKALMAAGVSYSARDYLPTAEKIKANLQQGKPVIIYVRGPSIFTNSEHWMALLDINGDEVFLANPSNSQPNGWYNIDIIMNNGIKQAFYIN